MKVFRLALRSFNDGVSHQFHQSHTVRTLSTHALSGDGMNDKQNSNSFESADDFEARIFSKTSEGNSKTDSFFAKLDRLGKTHDGADGFEARNFSSEGNSRTDSFFAKLDRLGKTRDGYASNLPGGSGSGSHVLDGLDESFNTLSDGMDGKLKKAAMYFEYDPEEVDMDGYTFRPDTRFHLGGTYELKDLDLTKPGVRKPPRKYEFEVTTKEVLQKADFRNVRFLANFITEAGVIIKRSKTKISAKAQRKVAREIKTARAFGLMPFTTMGTKSFAFGRNMQSLDEDFEYESFDNPTADDDERNPLGY